MGNTDSIKIRGEVEDAVRVGPCFVVEDDRDKTAVVPA